MADYVPELGQMTFGNPTGMFAVPEFAAALIGYCLDEIERVFWNVNQREWDRYEDPSIPGIEYRPYYWGECECGGQHVSGCPVELPNFKFEAVEIRWYKYPGRGMNCNIDQDAERWSEWFDRALTAIRAKDIDE